MILKISKQGKGELVFAGSLFLLGIFVAWDTSRMDVPQGSSIVSPQTFPYMVAAFTSLVGFILILDVLRGRLGTPEGDEPGDPFVGANFKTMAIIAAAIALHVILLEIAGYVIAATVCFFGVSYGFGSRRYLKDLGISLAFALVVYFSFTKGLNINLPSGFFEGVFKNG
ncbi:MAG: tripartite tricarboxylate transporter TctB family protein [Actinobacteria bacterium]|nr:tripartite tricarboxylate transporter TctB family protein [Actinomycetota bacterium]NCV82838.1 tripartite tricarboxylate transporter TctB family protein [Actinomycetota bacterium]NCW43478.1 tripartite tricarboxylate transporter TctB family protein [Actinomycetota bacterium]NCW71514.1 tripartite tricarboxylate transporter TctB family protein [Actinomycetota bacterium]NCX15849.1 tripartite tricarboxylate transporter TctB family protein [Actinomycetota bacterium]